MDADTVVVGAGPLGAAAARHLAMDPAAGRVVVIGPDEGSNGPFGAWHDEARITRVIADDDVWATLAEESIDRYPQIAAEGGQPFHQATGVLYVHEREEGFERQLAVAGRHRAVHRVAEPEDYPYLRLLPGTRLIDERGQAGVVNPRVMVANQLRAAVARGAQVVRDHVVAVEPGQGGVRVRTARGAEVRARRAVVAAGGYVNAFGLLPEPLPVTVVGITVRFFAVEGEVAAALAGMPAILWHQAADEEWLYALPPTRYPDGRWWFKIGGHHDSGPLQTVEEIDAWYRAEGSAAEGDFLQEWVAAHLPVLAGQEAHTASCVITETGDGLPIVREVAPGVVVASGCNGAAAKSSDEIGRLAALRCVHGG